MNRGNPEGVSDHRSLRPSTERTVLLEPLIVFRRIIFPRIFNQ